MEHYDAGFAILSYLYYAKDIGITYSASHLETEAFCNASWGRQPRDVFGFAIFFGDATATVSACAKQIKIITLTTQEAELHGYAQVACALRFAQMVIDFSGHQLHMPSPIHNDSSAAVPFIMRPGPRSDGAHAALREVSPLWTRAVRQRSLQAGLDCRH